jgi:hypothetical protein
MGQVYFCHSTQDVEFARRIADDLRADGMKVWTAMDSISIGDIPVEARERGLITSTHLVVLMSPSAVEDWWVNWEFNTAMELCSRGQIEILPIDYLPCEAPLRWQGFQALSGITDDYFGAISELVKRLQTTPPDQPQTVRHDLEADNVYQVKLTISTPTERLRKGQSNQLSIPEDYPQLDRTYQIQQIIFRGDPRLSSKSFLLLFRIEHADISLDNRDYGFSSARKALESTLLSDKFTTIDELLSNLTSAREPIPVGCDLPPTQPRKPGLQLDCAGWRELSEGVFKH